MNCFVGTVVVVFASLGTAVHGLESFQQRIPNGDRVVSPEGEPWPGVGHYRAQGGGDRNAFGRDFEAAGLEWTVELCEMDSDCDGYTNGQELGDPNCVWQEGDIPTFDAGVTHPGIPNTERDTVSTTETVERREAEGTCSDFSFADLPENHVNTTLLMPNYTVPTQRTTYAKYGFELTLPSDQYAIRVAPIIMNPNVVHHFLLYHCDREPTEFMEEPTTEGRMLCTELVYTWAVGGLALCLPQDVGILFDSEKPWYILDVHYDNPQGLEGIEDNSGIFVTTIPKEDAPHFKEAGFMRTGILPIGPFLAIPPQQEHFELASKECQFDQIPPEGVTVFTFGLHAHGLGRQIWTEVTRNEIPVAPEEDDNDDNAEEDDESNDVFLGNIGNEGVLSGGLLNGGLRGALPNSSCPAKCRNQPEEQCNVCFSDSGCCGSLSDDRCLPGGILCCSACEVCTGCEGCFAKTECNPNGSSDGYDQGEDNEINDNANDDEESMAINTTTFDLGCNTNFDFDLQETVPLGIDDQGVLLYATDTLVTHCVYDSSSRSETTYGGDATDDEMCINFFLYYPRIPGNELQCLTRSVEVRPEDQVNKVCNVPGHDIVELIESGGEACEGVIPNESQLARTPFFDLKPWLQVHIVCMQLSMGFLLPVGVLIAMSFRGALNKNNNGMWFQLHRAIQCLGVLLLLAGVAVVVWGMVDPHLTELHHKLGVAVVVLAFTQPLNALLRPHRHSSASSDMTTLQSQSNATPVSTTRSVWEFWHKNVGRLTILLGWANIFLGVRLLDDKWYVETKFTNFLTVIRIVAIVVLSFVALVQSVLLDRTRQRSSLIEQNGNGMEHKESDDHDDEEEDMPIDEYNKDDEVPSHQT